VSSSRPDRLPLILFLILVLMFTLCSPAIAADKDEDQDESPLNAGALAGLALRGIGPAFTSGRIADVVVDPVDPGTWYVAVGSGGVWKTVNAGTTWQSIFEGQSSYSIGCVTLDPSDHNTVWVGTGENVGGRHVGFGDGVYRSRDGGQTWENLGLKQSEHIGNIVVHPEDPNTVFVAAQGPLWSAGGERGLYLTTDGGVTWEKVLGGGEYTGVNEVRMDPVNPRVLYASTHQRLRDVAALVNGGPESGIHKSTDGGRTWRQLKTGLPGEDMGRIGLAISPQNPEVVYAAIELAGRTGGFWRSTDGGESWEKRNDIAGRGTGPHYYQEIFASPHVFDRVYFTDVQLAVTEDGGKNFRRISSEDKHVDNHALAFSASDPDYLLAGCDGGLYQSWDLGQTWMFVANLPVTQFYKIAVDYDTPFYHVIGGTQDNNTQYGPVRTDNVHGIRNADWRVTLFGDGHQPAIDPTNPDIFYSSLQQCSHYRVDRPTGEFVSIKPVPGEGEQQDRWNWDGPIVISRFDPARLYVASQRLWRSDDRGDSWRALSGDLTRGGDRLLRPMMGRVQSVDGVWDLVAMSEYATITSVAESPLDENLLYVGTDDGLIQVTEDGGQTWRQCKRPKDVPERIYVNNLVADRFDRATVYAVLDNHKTGDFAPYLFKSTDAGKSWKSIAGDLPERHIVWRLVQDTEKPGLLFCATEFGVFVTVDGGGKWLKLGGAPTISFRDLVIQERENDLVCASFGRGIYVLDDYTPLRAITEETLAEPALLFGPRQTWWYQQQRVLGGEPRGSMGTAYYTAPNPPFGAVFTYYLAESLQTAEQKRQEEEKKLAEDGADTPYPGWDALAAERLEDAPAVLMTVRDSGGDVVRTVSGPVDKGIHRVAWDLRYPSYEAERDGQPDTQASGVLAPPGTYTVELAQRVDGVTTALAGPENFEVVPLRERGLPGMNTEELAAFLRQSADLQRRTSAAEAVLDETVLRLDAIRVALDRASHGGTDLYASVVDLEKRVENLSQRLRGDRTRDRMKAGGPLSINDRLGVGLSSTWGSSYGPTLQQRDQLAIGLGLFEAWHEELKDVVEVELPSLEATLDATGIPWTAGRKW
jgi:photosystem II stability/assembly factor-like uncharacterized protein